MKNKNSLSLREKIKEKILENRSVFIKTEEALDSENNREVISRSFINDVDDEVSGNLFKTTFATLCAIILLIAAINIAIPHNPDSATLISLAAILAYPWISDLMICAQDKSNLLTFEKRQIIFHINHIDEIAIDYDEIIEIVEYHTEDNDPYNFDIIVAGNKKGMIIANPSRETCKNIRTLAMQNQIRVFIKKEHPVYDDHSF